MNRRDVLRSGTVATTGLGFGVLGAASPASSAPRPPGRLLRVHTVLYDGVEEQDFAGPVETFGIVPNDQHPIKQSFVTADGPRTVTTAAGIDIAVRTPWSPRSADVIVVPGGGLGPGSAVAEEIRRGVLPRALAGAAERPGMIIASVCTGALLLAAAKITAGRPCTTHHAAVELLKAQGGKVVAARVVDDGNLITSGGVTSGIDLALWLIERLYGPQTALYTEQVLEYERRGTVWRSR